MNPFFPGRENRTPDRGRKPEGFDWGGGKDIQG